MILTEKSNQDLEVFYHPVIKPKPKEKIHPVEKVKEEDIVVDNQKI